MLTVACELSAVGELYSVGQSQSANIMSLIEWQLRENLKTLDIPHEKVEADEVVLALERFAFDYFFTQGGRLRKHLCRSLTESGLAASLRTDLFIDSCLPFLSSHRQSVVFTSDFVGKCLAGRHIHRLGEQAGGEFYDGPFLELSKNEPVIHEGWWHALTYFDELRFFACIVEPVVRKTLSELDKLPVEFPFASFLRKLQLDMTLEFDEESEKYELRSSSVAPVDDLAEILTAPLTAWEFADWFGNEIDKAGLEQSGRLLRVFKSEGGKTRPKYLTANFADWQPNDEELASIEAVGSANEFSSKFRAFRAQLKLILESRNIVTNELG